MPVFEKDSTMNVIRRLVSFAALLSPLLVHAAAVPAVGSAAPEFSLRDQGGKTWRLAGS